MVKAIKKCRLLIDVVLSKYISYWLICPVFIKNSWNRKDPAHSNKKLGGGGGGSEILQWDG